jgi:polyphenol oxidase
MIINPSIFSTNKNLICGLSTKLGGNPNPPFYNNLSFWVNDDKETVQKNRDIFFDNLGINQSLLAIPQQTHSDTVQIVTKPGYYRNTDGLITKEKNLFLIISTADCFPVLIYDRSKQVVAAIHSGWRGTQKEIIKKALNLMINELECKPENLFVFIGPGICAEHFEVGKEVAEMFKAEYVIKNSEKYYVKLKDIILQQIKSFYIPDENIESSTDCTYHNDALLHSYRRDKENSGRMFSVIGMK